MSEFYIRNLENEINLLASLVTNAKYLDPRFDMAVAHFQLFLDNAEENNIPLDLARTLRNINRFNYGDQQSYVDDLRREYNKYCKEKEETMTSETSKLYEGRGFTIDEDGVILRDGSRVKYDYERALDLINKEILFLESLVASGDDMEDRFVNAVAKFKEKLNTSNYVPKDLASRFTSHNYQPYSNQQAYINDLKRELKWCREDMKPKVNSDTLKQTLPRTIEDLQKCTQEENRDNNADFWKLVEAFKVRKS